MTPVYIKSTDADAPVLNPGKPVGSFALWMKQIMVRLGWTIEYDAGNKVAFRNNPNAPGSSGCYLWVDHTSVIAKVAMYKSMTDIDVGVERIPQNETAWVTYYTEQWKVIGDDRTVYLAFWNGSFNSYCTIYGFGDYDSIDPTNDYNYMINARAFESDSEAYNDSFGYIGGTTEARMTARDLNNTPGSNVRFVLPGPLGFISGSANTSWAAPGAMLNNIPIADSVIWGYLNPRIPYGKMRGLRTLAYVQDRKFLDGDFNVDQPYAVMIGGGGQPAAFGVALGEW